MMETRKSGNYKQRGCGANNEKKKRTNEFFYLAFSCHLLPQGFQAIPHLQERKECCPLITLRGEVWVFWILNVAFS